MKFIVTGVTGFAGSHLAEKLVSENHQVFGFYRSNSEFDKIDNVDYRFYNLEDQTDPIAVLLHENDIDGIFHLAAQTHPPTSFEKRYHFFKVNALGTLRICQYVEDISPSTIFHYCSTSEVYGITEKVITEKFPLNPSNPYAVSKASADMYVQEACKNGRLRGFITRAFSHTGPRRKSNYSISSDAIQLARMLKGKQAKNIIGVGNLESQRVVIDVRDVVDVYYQLMMKSINKEMQWGEIYNICGDDLHPIRYYLELMMDMFHIHPTPAVDPDLYRKIDIPIQRPNSDKVRKFLNWQPSIPIERTLTDLVNYWLEKV